MRKINRREIRDTYRGLRGHSPVNVEKATELTAWALQLDLDYVRKTLGLAPTTSRAGRNQYSKAAHLAKQAAFLAGNKTYIGAPCPNGHDGTRYTTGGNCVQCTRDRRRKEYLKSRLIER